MMFAWSVELPDQVIIKRPWTIKVANSFVIYYFVSALWVLISSAQLTGNLDS